MTGPGARGRVRPDLVYIGWQPASLPEDPGPRPRPPAPAPPDQVSQDWVAAQRREHGRLTQPVRRAVAACLAVAGLAAAGRAGGLIATPLAVTAGLAAAVTAALCGRQLRRDGRALAGQLAAEHERVARFQVLQSDQQLARRQEHARRLSDWQQRRAAVSRQPHWHPVTLPAVVGRLDLAGGTLAGWSALLTMLAGPRLAAGGEVSVFDLTEGGTAADLVAVARRCGFGPRVLVLPADLPRLELGAGLSQDLRADLLARAVAAAGGAAGSAATGQAGDPAGDAALLSRVLAVLGADASMPQLLAALRALGQIGAPAEHLGSADLTAAQLASLAGLAGRGAERLVIERAWAIEARLRALAPLGTALPAPPADTAAWPAGSQPPGSQPPSSPTASRLTVTWLDRRAAAVGNGVLAAYLATALTASLSQAPPGRPWQQTICLIGAERLPGEVLDRLADAAELAGAGLVLAYRSIPAHVRERLGRGNAATAFMRLGNAEDARLAAEQIGTEHRFVVSQLTDSVGRSLTGTAGDSYTSTAGTADSLAGSQSLTLTSGRSRGHGRSRQGLPGPLGAATGSASRDASSSAALSDSVSITEGISTGTSWGWSTSAAVGSSDSLAWTAQRSREFLVEQHELQQLPPTAVLLCCTGPGGRQVVLADANPAIMTLPTATMTMPAATMTLPAAGMTPPAPTLPGDGAARPGPVAARS